MSGARHRTPTRRHRFGFKLVGFKRTALVLICVLFGLFMTANLLYAHHLLNQGSLHSTHALHKTTKNTAVAATYNLWNGMFGWPVRRLHIAEIIQQAELDFVGLQEARRGLRVPQSDANQLWGSTIDQIMELQKALPEFSVAEFEAANEVQPGLWEGVGLLSRHRIEKRSAVNLSATSGADPTGRVALHCVLAVPAQPSVSVFVTHFSYNRPQQCRNALDLRHFILTEMQGVEGLRHIVVLGDFNAYPDHPGPVQLLRTGTGQGCDLQAPASPLQLLDAGEARGSLTFSTMPSPGLQSRPDLVLFGDHVPAKGLSWARSLGTSLLGDGEAYKHRWWLSMLARRAEAVLWHSEPQAPRPLGPGGAPDHGCLQDCGPNGVCACSVCIRNEVAAKLADTAEEARFEELRSKNPQDFAAMDVPS